MPNPNELVDKSVIEELFEVELEENKTLFHELLPEFKEKTIGLHQSLKQMIEMSVIPFKDVAFAAHKVAGSCGNIGLSLSTSQAQLLEEVANENDAEAVRHAFSQLNDSLFTSIEVLENIFSNGLSVAA